MSDIQENVIITITRKPSLYFGPNMSFIQGFRENQCTYQGEKHLDRKSRLSNWYEIDDRYSHYTIKDFDDYLDGMSIDVIRHRQKKYEELQSSRVQEYEDASRQYLLEAITPISENTINIPIYDLKFLNNYEEPWDYSDTTSNYSKNEDNDEGGVKSDSDECDFYDN